MSAAESEKQDPAIARFDEWARTPTPEPAAPSAAAITPTASPYAAPDIDQETQAYIDQRESTLRQEIARELRHVAASTTEETQRAALWNRFQDRYPEFANQDEFIASSFQAVTGGRLPEPAMYDAMLARVHDNAIERRDALLKQSGYEIVDDEPTEGRTEGISVEGVSGNKAATPKKDEDKDDGTTLTSTLVEQQGNTEFYPDTTPEMLSLYKKDNLG